MFTPQEFGPEGPRIPRTASCPVPNKTPALERDRDRLIVWLTPINTALRIPSFSLRGYKSLDSGPFQGIEWGALRCGK